jgi:ribosomal protein L28
MRHCTICGKTSSMGGHYKKVKSQYDPTPKRRIYPNLQWVRLPSGKRVKACTKCIKTMAKTRKK